ncbi:MAG: hypothetical protein LBJ67_03330 [Planctomycetaceae bacterium]|nr:hypothetical protein [Planctomycetaceae bacterium]
MIENLFQSILVYSGCFKVSEAEHTSVASRSDCLMVRSAANTSFGVIFVLFVFWGTCTFATEYAQAVLKFPKLDTQTQEREAVAQGRSLSPIPDPVHKKNIYPIGRNIDSEIQFEATVMLNTPISQTKTGMFLNYYVSPRDIAYEIVWTEPAWISINFPYPAFDLYGHITPSRYRLFAAPHQKKWDYDLSGSSRKVFTHVLNNYKIEDQRYAFIEYLVTRFTERDLFNVIENRLVKLRPITSFPRYSVFYNISPDCLNIKRTERYDEVAKNVITSEKRLNYVYQNGQLEEIQAELAEHSIPAGGFTVNVQAPKGKHYKLVRIPVVFHKGGRICTVSYFTEKKEFDFPIQLPQNIIVRNKNLDVGDCLRWAKLSNYKKIPKGTVANTKELLAHFDSDFELLDKKYRELSLKYWYLPVSSVSQEDISWLRHFADICAEKFDKERSDARKLKYLNRWLLSDMLSGNIDRIVDISLPLYLSILKDNNLAEIELVGLSDLIHLFTTRKEKDTLIKVVSSEKIKQVLVASDTSALKKSLSDRCNNCDVAIAILFAKLGDAQLTEFHKIEDVFVMRYFIVEMLKNIIQLQKRDPQLYQAISQLMLLLEMKSDAIVISMEEQKNLLQQSYKKIINPSQELQQKYKSVLDDNK